jgi:RNA polymerase sigma-70 factor, ECF subfamily
VIPSVTSASVICTVPAEDELTLARRVAGGDRAAFELIMRRYNRRLYRLLPERLSRVLNECGARQRRSARGRSIIPLVSSATSKTQTESVADVSEGPDWAAARTQLRAILEGKLGELPEALRVVFVLRSVEELSVAETAETLGIAEETVRMRHFRAKGMLREALAREIDLAETDLFEFGGVHCDGVVASVRAKLSL